MLLSALEQAVVAVVRAYRAGLGYGPTQVEIANATKVHPSHVDQPVDASALGSLWADGAGLDALASGGGGLVIVTQVTDTAWGLCCIAVSLDGGGSLSGRVVDVLGGRVCVGHVPQASLSKDLRHLRGSAAHGLRVAVLAAAQWRGSEGGSPPPDGAG